MGDGRYMDPERLTSDGHLLNDRLEPCPKCGYQRASMPAWVWFGVVFVLDDERWVVSSMGSTNQHTRGRLDAHFEDVITAQVIEQGVRVFAPKTEVRRRECSIEDMERATFIELLPGAPKREKLMLL
jgi:hypothetical protein